MSRKRKKKSRRNRASGAKKPQRAVASGGRQASPREFNPDYSYVIQDLRRIGVLAGSFIVILVILSFILG
jgi:hypothetical protein